jgi:hypothetical protein
MTVFVFLGFLEALIPLAGMHPNLVLAIRTADSFPVWRECFTRCQDLGFFLSRKLTDNIGWTPTGGQSPGLSLRCELFLLNCRTANSVRV